MTKDYPHHLTVYFCERHKELAWTSDKGDLPLEKCKACGSTLAKRTYVAEPTRG